MRVLVTGACGWTAVSILDALRQNGHDIAAFDLDGMDHPDDADFTAGDVSDFAAVAAAMRNTDAVVHLAVTDTYDAPDLPFSVNVKGTYNIFAAARRHNVTRIALMSSACVHLEGTDPVDALTDWHSSPDDDHLYDLSKRLQEEIAQDFCQTFRMTCVALRAGQIA